MAAYRWTRIVLVCSVLFMRSGSSESVCGGTPADVVFVVDASSSIWGPDFDKQLTFVQDVIAEFDVRPSKTRCGLLTFSDQVRVEFSMGTFGNARALTHAVSRVHQLQGSTHTDLALARMLEMFEFERRRGVPRLAIVLTDGESVDTDLTSAVADLVHDAGVTVIAIGIGRDVNQAELQQIATSGEYVFEVDSYDALDKIRIMLAIKACSVGEGEQGDAAPPTPPTRGCDGKPADVVFALDASSSIWEQDFDTQLSFVRDVISIFEISPEATRVGVLTFGDEVESQFYLDRYMDEEHLIKAVRRVRQNPGNTNTAEALRVMRRRYFSRRRSRDGVVHIGVVLTDGRSDDTDATAREARRAREAGIHLFAIGIGQDVDQRELYSIASEPTGQHVFEVSTYDALGSIKNLLAMKTCEVTEPPTTTKPTTTIPPPTGCSAQLPADIMFALPRDATDAQSAHVLKLVGNVTRALDIDSDAVRFGLVPKHCFSVPGFDLTSGGASHDDVIDLISSVTTRDSAISNSVVQYLCDVSFQPIRGAREDATKIGVVFVSTERGLEALEAAALEAATAGRQHGVHFIVVGVGEAVSETQLESLGVVTDVLTVPSYQGLSSLTSTLTQRFHQHCLESFHSHPVHSS